MDYYFYFIASLAVILTGIAKAGFGGGVGIAATPLLLLVTSGSKEAIGIMLPILCSCDLFAVYHYRRTYDGANLLRLIPGAILGIAAGSFFLGKFSEEFLSVWIGIISVAFVFYQWGKTWILKELRAYRPKFWQGCLFGSAVGFTSTLAHAGGPPATMFLLPQNLGRQLFVGTTVFLFTAVNAVKLIPYFYFHIINLERISTSLILLPLVPIGTYLGVWMNRRLNETAFNGVIYVFLLLIGFKLITGINPVGFLFEIIGLNQAS